MYIIEKIRGSQSLEPAPPTDAHCYLECRSSLSPRVVVAGRSETRRCFSTERATGHFVLAAVGSVLADEGIPKMMRARGPKRQAIEIGSQISARAKAPSPSKSRTVTNSNDAKDERSEQLAQILEWLSTNFSWDEWKKK